MKNVNTVNLSNWGEDRRWMHDRICEALEQRKTGLISSDDVLVEVILDRFEEQRLRNSRIFRDEIARMVNDLGYTGADATLAVLRAWMAGYGNGETE